MRQPRKHTIPRLLVGALLIQMHVQAAEPSNNTILGAIPQSFDNIGIVRFVDMDADTVVGAEFLRETRSPPGMQRPTDAMPLSTYIAERLNADGLAIAVQALSNQDVGAGMDSSPRNMFRLYVTEQNTDALMQAVSGRNNIQQIDHPQYAIYQDTSTGNPVYVAFLNETMVLVTNSQDDITNSASALLAQDAQPAPNWSALSATDTDAPVLILRYLQLPMTPPPGADVPHHENFVLGMWMSDMSAPVFQVEASSDLQLADAEDYIRTVGAIEVIYGPEGIAFNLEEPAESQSNYSGTLELLHSEMGDHYTDLAFLWLLGIWFVI